ncbi:MAG: SBBP repeat-containing protein [Bacteroidales bacterium]|nr:SBBP repeat-containing protein [Bacteroidales bacterium]MCF8458204.1 SBBP repeat-containing protein [Bacteroidales bacterium]
MRNKIFTLLGLLWLSSNLLAQEPQFEWAASFYEIGYNYGYSIIVDDTGNVYTTGYFSHTADFDPGIGTFNLSSHGCEDIFISKLDAFGNFVWAKSIGGSTYDKGLFIALDAVGNVYTTGYFCGTVDFDPGNGTYNLNSNGTSDVFILKLDASGNFVWAKSIGGSSGDQGNSVVVDAAGNVYTTGVFLYTVDFNPGSGTFNINSSGGKDVFVMKLNASGKFVWAKSMGGSSSDYCNSIALDAEDNIYTTGQFSDTADFDPGSGTYYLNSNGGGIFIWKLDSSGNLVLAKNIVGSSTISGGKGWSIAPDAFGNVYTIGCFQDTVDFDPGSGVYNLISNTGLDIFISKLDIAGNFIWAKRIGSCLTDIGYSIALDKAGNIYTTGKFAATVDFDPGNGTYNLSSTDHNQPDIFILKLNANGNFVWAKKMGNYSTDVGNSIVLDAAGNVYTTGWFYGIVDFDPGNGIFNLFGGDAAFILKLSQGQALQADFMASNTNAIIGDTIQFNDLTTGSIVSWHWNFGDGETDGTQNPIHVYQTAGIYTVSLIISDGNNGDILIKQDYIAVNPLSIFEEGHGIQGIQLFQNVPNPFATETEFPFYLSTTAFIELDIFNVLGERVGRVYSGELKQGNQSIKFNNEKLKSGTYYYRLKTEDYSATRKMVILKR